MKISVEDTSSSRRDFIKAVGATVVGAGLVDRAGGQPTQLENKPPLIHLSAKKLAQMSSGISSSGMWVRLRWCST
jgi:hypothetical protein